MRALFVVGALDGGGAEFGAAQWARYLAQTGEPVTVYTVQSTNAAAVPDGVSVVHAPAPGLEHGPHRFMVRTRDLARYLRRAQPDVVVAIGKYWSLSSVIAVRSRVGKRPKVVVSLHGMARNGLSSWPETVTGWLARKVFRYADGVLAVSHAVAAEAVALYGISAERVAVVPNPALAKIQHRIAPAAGSKDPDHLHLVVPARLVPVKRPLLALDVAACLESEFPGGVTVHYFGSGELHDAVVERARELGVDAIMHGWVENWFDECPPGSVVLLPSLSEGFGTVLIEAAAAGFKSVASSRSRGVADGIVPGITGELTVGDRPEDFATAVLVASREEVHGVDTWLQRFSLENSGAILRGILGSVHDADQSGPISQGRSVRAGSAHAGLTPRESSATPR